MISYLPMGRMGNALFQSAACIALALRNGCEYSMPTRTSSDFWSPLILPHLINPRWEQGRADIIIEEQQFHFSPIEYSKEWDNRQVLLKGYFQSEKYFIDFKDEIINLFNYHWQLIPDVCSIQGRFGDYLTIAGKHILVDEPYLKKSMALITEKTGIIRFKVFSDDIPYFKSYFGHLYNFEYSNNTDITQDLIDISCCHSNINSSSTFAWWASFLNRNPDKIIITQEKWFREGWDNADTKDIIPQNWIKL